MTYPTGGYSLPTQAVAGSRTARSAPGDGDRQARSPFPNPSNDTLVFSPWPDQPLAAFASPDAGTAWHAGDLTHAGGGLPRYYASPKAATASAVPASFDQASHSVAAGPPSSEQPSHGYGQPSHGYAPTWGPSAQVHDTTPSLTDRVVGKLEDAGIRADVAKALAGAKLDDPFHLDHAALTHILEDAAVGGVTASEFRTLKTLDGLINKSGGFQASEYDAYITHALIAGNPANVDWTGGTTGDSVPLGNLAAGSSELQADRLIGKWFLGTDHPGLKDTFTLADYATDPDPLFGKSGKPSWQDFRMGDVGDCWLAGGLGEIALKDPTTIEQMFTDNGDGTYGVRFYDWNDKPVYVTVDSQLTYTRPDTGTDHSSLTYISPEVGSTDRSKWASLVEKAYAQLNDSGTKIDQDYIRQYELEHGPHSADGVVRQRGNFYIRLNGGLSEAVHDITGKHISYTNDPEDPKLLSALRSGQEVVAAADKEISNNYVADHLFTVLAYDERTHALELRNPWGGHESWSVFWTTPEELKLNQTSLIYVSEPSHFSV